VLFFPQLLLSIVLLVLRCCLLLCSCFCYCFSFLLRCLLFPLLLTTPLLLLSLLSFSSAIAPSCVTLFSVLVSPHVSFSLLWLFLLFLLSVVGQSPPPPPVKVVANLMKLFQAGRPPGSTQLKQSNLPPGTVSDGTLAGSNCPPPTPAASTLVHI
jgi:hypothetical protein